MNATDLIDALDLPVECRVDQRVPKKLLVEKGAPTAADKCGINDGIEEIRWLAALKPTTIGVSEYRDEVREYLEIAVLSVMLRPGAKETRLTELIHRAVPYPVFLVTTAHDQSLILSLAHKRWAQNEADKVVLEDEVVGAHMTTPPLPTTLKQTFLASLSLGRQSRPHLFALYQGWLDAILAVQAASITGTFTPTASIEDSLARRMALQQVQQLEAQIVALRKTAAKERQMARQVELNLELQRLLTQLADARGRL
ncbi:MAG: DUF4391 domain-containing protein [Desulfobulbaceae bacterium]|nr:DUF4391 domain-containing protein [Desulfobulbaceae bacterium]